MIGYYTDPIYNQVPQPEEVEELTQPGPYDCYTIHRKYQRAIVREKIAREDYKDLVYLDYRINIDCLYRTNPVTFDDDYCIEGSEENGKGFRDATLEQVFEAIDFADDQLNA